MFNKFQYLCAGCARLYPATEYRLHCTSCGSKALLRAQYEEQSFIVAEHELGFNKFHHWLPLASKLSSSVQAASYRSSKFAQKLGLSNLSIIFNGYWPEKGAQLLSCSFKEWEALVVSSMLKPKAKKAMVVASAGNTARGFLQVASKEKIPMILVVPADKLPNLFMLEKQYEAVKIVCVEHGMDYYDAIRVAAVISESESFYPEGGVFNVARRAGLSIPMLEAVWTQQHMFDYYFQAIGSGTGAIACWEASEHIAQANKFAPKKTRLMLAQSQPFTPVHDAWTAKKPELAEISEQEGRDLSAQVYDAVLANRKAPYSIRGGLYDILKASEGRTYGISSQAAQAAQELFESTEGIDIMPAAAIAVAALIEAVKKQQVEPDAKILLNITGGGVKKLYENYNIRPVNANLIIKKTQDRDSIISHVESLF